MVRATMAESELLASLTQPTPATLTQELRFSLMAQRALIFLLLTQTDAPMPPVLETWPLLPLAAAGGSAVGAAAAAETLPLSVEPIDESTSCFGVVSGMEILLFPKARRFF